MDSKGHITVDEYQNRSWNGVYARGDVCGKALLKPVAIAVGRLAHRLFEGKTHLKLDYDNVPTVVFGHLPTDPYQAAAILHLKRGWTGINNALKIIYAC